MELTIAHSFRDTLDTRSSSDFPCLALSYIRSEGKVKARETPATPVFYHGGAGERDEGEGRARFRTGEDYPLWRLAVVTSAWVGVQCLWVSEFSLTQPYMEYLGMSADLAALTWIWGPITGFIVAPLVGAASDRCESSYGRRRPFMIGGLFSFVFFSLLYAASRYFFGLTQASQYFALLMFIGMDATINIIQTPLRALISDLSSSRQQAVGQLMAAGFQGIGGIIGAAMMLPFAEEKGEKALPVVALATGLNLIVIPLSCILAKERPYIRPLYLRKPGCVEPLKQSFIAVRFMPRSLVRIAVVQFFSWIGLFCLWTFKVTWWAKIAYPGCTQREVQESARECNSLDQVESYNQGVKMNDTVDLVAYAGQTLVGLCLACLLSYRAVSIRFLYAGMLLWGAGLFYLLSFSSGKVALGAILLSMICLPIVAINSFPFALVGAYIRSQTDRENDTGVQMGVLNLLIVIPQALVTCVSSVFQGVDLSSWLFLVVAIAFTLAGGTACLLQVKFVSTPSSPPPFEGSGEGRERDSVDDERIVL